MQDEAIIELKDSWIDPAKQFPHPKWPDIAEWIESNHPEAEWDSVWTGIARGWLMRVSETSRSDGKRFESESFLLLAPVSAGKADEVLRFLESTYQKIQEGLPFAIDEDLYFGKFVVMVFDDHLEFYEYLADYTNQDGEFGGVGGVYINRGYGHFVMPSDDLAQFSDVLSHEMSHAMLSHLVLPAWLDEAIAMTVENSITFRNPYILDREMIERHQDYWTEERIGDFWKGESFWYPDEGQELSYHLARFLFTALLQGGETPKEIVQDFIVRAKWEDAGAGAFFEIFEFRLSDLITELLGEGDWAPRIREPEPAES